MKIFQIKWQCAVLLLPHFSIVLQHAITYRQHERRSPDIFKEKLKLRQVLISHVQKCALSTECQEVKFLKNFIMEISFCFSLVEKR